MSPRLFLFGFCVVSDRVVFVLFVASHRFQTARIALLRPPVSLCHQKGPETEKKTPMESVG